MFTFSPNQNLIASLSITVFPPPLPPATAIFVACWMAWVTGRVWLWRLAASRILADSVRIFLSYKEYKGRKRLLVLKLNIKVAVVRRTLLLVGGGGWGADSTFPLFFTKNVCHRYPPNPVSFPVFGESRFSGSSQIPSLRASSLGHSDGEAGKERRASNYVSGIWISPPNSLWLPVDWAVRLPPISANVNKHWKPVLRVMTSLLMSSPPISISHRLFRCRYSNSKDGPESLLADYQILYHSNVSRISAIPFQTLHHVRFAVLLTLLTNAWPTCTGVI